ncbi:MAG: hypothetical protein ACRC62_18970 [Microcoleus sp.]
MATYGRSTKKKEEGRRKKEEGRKKREEGKGKREECTDSKLSSNRESVS